MEVEHCIRSEGKEIPNFLHKIDRTVDKGWPHDMNRIAGAQQNTERETQARQKRQRYTDHSPRRLKPKDLQRKDQKYLMEHQNAT